MFPRISSTRSKTWLFGAVSLIVLISSASLILAASNASDKASDAEWAALHPDEYRDAVLKERHRSDPILALYRDQGAQEEVVAFFTAIVHSEKLARIILKRAEEYDVSPSLAAALSWEESKFNPRAVNRNAASIDRGLFQLNSKSFPKLAEKEFFDPDLNARYGIAHLRWCLDLAGTDVSALAMYNAGTTRVRSDSTPKKTLDYVARILQFKNGVDALFARELGVRWLVASDGSVKSLAPAKPSGETRLASVLFPLLNAGPR